MNTILEDIVFHGAIFFDQLFCDIQVEQVFVISIGFENGINFDALLPPKRALSLIVTARQQAHQQYSRFRHFLMYGLHHFQNAIGCLFYGMLWAPRDVVHANQYHYYFGAKAIKITFLDSAQNSMRSIGTNGEVPSVVFTEMLIKGTDIVFMSPRSGN